MKAGRQIIGSTVDQILYGRVGAHGSSPELVLSRAISQLSENFRSAQAGVSFPVALLRQSVSGGSLFSLLQGTAFSQVHFSQGLDQQLKEVPALVFSATMSVATLHSEYPQKEPGQESMCAEWAMQEYLRALGFQQVATTGPMTGRADIFAGDVQVSDKELMLETVIIADDVDLSDLGIHRGDLGWDKL